MDHQHRGHRQQADAHRRQPCCIFGELLHVAGNHPAASLRQHIGENEVFGLHRKIGKLRKRRKKSEHDGNQRHQRQQRGKSQTGGDICTAILPEACGNKAQEMKKMRFRNFLGQFKHIKRFLSESGSSNGELKYNGQHDN